MSIKPRKMLVPQSKWGTKCPYTMEAEFIVIHNTANDASANNEISYMISNNNQTSFHFAVDDKEVVQGILLNRNAWHAGDGGNGRGNRKGIAIEICYSLSGGERFDKAERLAAQFIAQLLDERKWGIDKVTKHQDYSGKYCPSRTLDRGWQRFLDMVKGELDKLHTPVISWTLEEPMANVIAIAPTALIDIVTGAVIKEYPAGYQFTFAEHALYNGKAYYRTSYSQKMNVNNGFLMSDFAPVLAEKEKVTWKTLPATVYIAGEECRLVNVATGEVVKEYPVGAELGTMVETTTINGVPYYRTDTMKTAKKNHGFDASTLVKPTEPMPEEKVPEAKENRDVRYPDPDPASSPEYTENVAGVWETIINAIKNLFKTIFKKG